MNEDDQIKAIAELDGWKPNGLGGKDTLHDPKGCTCFDGKGCYIPNYLTSRDAIIPVIEKQSFVMKTQVVDFLCELMLEEYDGSDYVRQSDVPLLLCATPSQLCQALLRATGKWKD